MQQNTDTDTDFQTVPAQFLANSPSGGPIGDRRDDSAACPGCEAVPILAAKLYNHDQPIETNSNTDDRHWQNEKQ